MTPDELNNYLTDFVDKFDFTRPGHSQSLARDVADVVVECIQERSSRGVGPDGDAWEANSGKSTPWLPGGYRQWKMENYGWDDPNYRTGQMLSKMSLGGNIQINPHDIVIAYGTNTPPTRGGSPNSFFDPETDGKVTDTQKAEWAHEDTGEKPARPFYGLGDGDDQAIVELCQENLNDYILSSPYGVP
jgi:hypothetical protein